MKKWNSGDSPICSGMTSSSLFKTLQLTLKAAEGAFLLANVAMQSSQAVLSAVIH